jgi:hypothetical protein
MRVKLLINLSVFDAGRLGLRASDAQHGEIVEVDSRAASELLGRHWAEAIADETPQDDDQADEPEDESESDEQAPDTQDGSRQIYNRRRRKTKKNHRDTELRSPHA